MSAFNSSRNALHETRTLFAVELHPSTVGNVVEGVKEQLNAHLLRYVDEFDGVLLSYSNVEILTKKPIIHPYFPYFHLDVRADVLVFKPTRGMLLVGRVNHLGEDYISALVMGVFNVSIPARSVAKDLHFLREEAKWIHTKQPQHQITEQSYVVFKVEEVRDHGGFFQITGSMRDPGTGASDFLHPSWELPEPPVLDLAGADVQMFDAVDGPTTTATAAAGGGGAGTTPAAVKSAAKPVDGPAELANGDDAQKGWDGKRKHKPAGLEDPKPKRRRKDEEKGPVNAAAEAGAQALTPAHGVGDGDGVADKQKRHKSDKKRDTDVARDLNGKEKGASAHKSDKKKDRDQVKDDTQSGKKKDKDKASYRAADGASSGPLTTAAAVTHQAVVVGATPHGLDAHANGVTDAAIAIGGARPVSGEKKHKNMSSKDGKDSHRKDAKAEADESGRKDGSKGDGTEKQSSRKDGKDKKQFSKKTSKSKEKPGADGQQEQLANGNG